MGAVGSMRTKTVLKKAYAILEPEGAWCQFNFKQVFHDGTVKYCMVGALREAAGGGTPSYQMSKRQQRAYQRALRRLEKSLGERKAWAAAWNDERGRTQSEVLQALDTAIKA